MTVNMSGIIITPYSVGGSLDGLDDVTITNPADGQVLTFDGVTLQWVNENPVPTNLSLGTVDGTTVTILSSTGTSVTLPSASPTFAGVMTSSEHQKLAGIATGATANQTDAYLLSRTNHTGTQTASTISNFVETAQDAVASLLVAGSNITLDYNDAANTLTISAAGGMTGTNLTQGTRTATTVEITSSTGTAATLTAASDTLAGVMTAADKIKLDTVQPNSYLLDRTNHTNTQLAATISDFAEATETAIDGYLEPGTNISFTYNSTTDKLIISASGGGGTVSLPEAQIAFGDVNNDITSSAELTYNNTTGDLIIGSAGPGAITSNVGETLTITGDAGIQLNTATGPVTVNAGTGASIIESVTGEELVITGDTGLTLSTNANGIIIDLPAATLVTVADFAAYDTALLANTGNAFITKSYANDLVSGLPVVNSFNTRTGTIVPEVSDYAAFYVQPGDNVSDLTNDAGYLTAATLPPSNVTLTETQIAYGDVNNEITSSTALVFDEALDTLRIGALAGNSMIESGTGQSMTVLGDTGLTLQVNTGNITLATAGMPVITTEVGQSLSIEPDVHLFLNGLRFPFADGTAGQAIVTDGAGTLSFSTNGVIESVFGRTGVISAEANDYAAFYATFAQGAKADTALQVIPYSDTNPLMNGVATQGVSTNVSRQDHVHPSDTTKINVSLLGVADGVATLDATAKVPASQLPSYVDDVVEYPTLNDFPATGETGKIYIAIDTSLSYRWSGTVYVLISSGAVQSVFTRTGVISAEANDYAAFYATTAQGVLADSAVQPNDNVSTLTNDAGYITLAEVTATEVVYDGSVSQLAGNVQAAIDQLDAAVDSNTALAHSHSNKAIIDGITDAGSGQIITVQERTKLGSALQPGDNVSELLNDAGYITAAAIPINPATTAAMVAYDGSTSGLVGNTVQDAIDEIVAAPDAITSVFGRAGAVVATEGDYTLGLLGDVTISSPATNEVLTYTGSGWANLPSQSGAPSLPSTQIAFGSATDTISGNSEFTYDNRLLKVGYNDASGGIMINGATRSISAITPSNDSHLNLITTGTGLIKVADAVNYSTALGALTNILTDDALITKKYFKDNDQITVARLDALEQTIANQAALIESLRVQLDTLMYR